MERAQNPNTPKKVLDGINFVLGLWLIIAPWALGTSMFPISTWTSVIIGIAVVIVSGWGMAQAYNKASEYILVALGAIFFLSPWLLGFRAETAAWNAWLIGAAILILALVSSSLTRRYRIHPHS